MLRGPMESAFAGIAAGAAGLLALTLQWTLLLQDSAPASPTPKRVRRGLPLIL
jgi:hypothetical protein